MSHKSTPEVVSSLSSPLTLPTQVAWAFPRVISSLSPVYSTASQINACVSLSACLKFYPFSVG